MANAYNSSLKFPLLLATIISTLFLRHSSATYAIGINYGTVADNLPSPPQVATFIKDQTTINKIKIFDANPDILRAFSNSDILVTIAVANSDVLPLTKLPAAQSWVVNNVSPFYPQTKINRIAVGNEILATGDKNLIAHLLPAMKTLHAALNIIGINDIKVTTPHSLGILSKSEPPSSGRFRRVYDKIIFAPMLEFHRQTKSPFMVCPYPYFGFSDKTLNYALFKQNGGVFDKLTGMNYTNMFDAQMDAIYSAMNRLGYGDVEIVVGETGWPSAGEPNQPGVSLENAASYNENLVRHVRSGKGTPLMPNRTFETYVFSLFNEDLKPSIPERNFGLFRPDFSPVYDVGILRKAQVHQWCVPKQDATDEDLQETLDFVCGSEVDCKPIQDGGPCFDPNTVRSHAAYAMNAYFQKNGRHDFNCYFFGTGMIVTADPSYDECKYES